MRGVTLLTLLSIGVNVAADVDPQLVLAAKEAAAYNMRDPDSAKFRGLRVRDGDKGAVVCGQINAKNVYGAYSGYVRFFHQEGGVTKVQSLADDLEKFEIWWNVFCDSEEYDFQHLEK